MYRLLQFVTRDEQRTGPIQAARPDSSQPAACTFEKCYNVKLICTIL